MIRKYPDNPLLGPLSRAEFITQNLRLVYKIARRHASRAEALRIPFEDVVGEGIVGLILAYDRFSNAGVAFSSYAAPYINGFILADFRGRGYDVHIPRRIYNVMHRILREGLEDSPSEETSQYLGISVKLAEEAKYCVKIRRAESLEARQSADDDDRQSSEPGVIFDDTEADVAQFLGLLRDRQRRIITLLMRGYSQTEIAGMLGVSRQAVSQAVAQVRSRYLKLYGGAVA